MIVRNTTPFRKLIWYKRLLGETTPSVEKTVSGSIIHVTDALAKFVKNLTVSIEPVQSGSGDPDPDNIRPITGWTGCNAYRSGADTSNPTIYSITFPAAAGTVYGGTLNVTTGVLTVYSMILEFNGTEEWQVAGSNDKKYYIYIISNEDIGYTPATQKCSHYKYSTISSGNTTVGYRCYKSTNDYRLALRPQDVTTTYDTVDKFKAYLAEQYAAETPVQVWLKLKNAYTTTYQLTPTQVKLLLGENYIWADTGDTELTYLAEA